MTTVPKGVPKSGGRSGHTVTGADACIDPEPDLSAQL